MLGNEGRGDPFRVATTICTRRTYEILEIGIPSAIGNLLAVKEMHRQVRVNKLNITGHVVRAMQATYE